MVHIILSSHLFLLWNHSIEKISRDGLSKNEENLGFQHEYSNQKWRLQLPTRFMVHYSLSLFSGILELPPSYEGMPD